ncbi:MAG: Spy/CpxP family protein refolding chaperone [Elusimicrobiota bacterium]|nr:MAG: Spy/CpxP family protein refolding chaperone [Elusimicrobiota bacterium]
MKKLSSNLGAAALLAGALLLPAALRAEKDGPKGGKPESREDGPRGKWKEKLGLTEEQEAKLKGLRRAHREESESARAEVKAAVRKLADQLEDKASEKELTATLDRIQAGRKSLHAQREKFEASAAAILTPTQRARMAVAMGRMMERGPGGKRGFGRKHGRGWGEHEDGPRDHDED